MITLLFRTIIIYIFLLITMRLMGKRQLGELELSELVSTILLSDIASLPITNEEIPLSYALVPILTITTFEILSSFALTKFPRLKGLFSTRPSMVIQRGIINKKELLRNRISIDELLSELRQKNVTDITQVDYAIIEQNGKMTVIPKAAYASPTREDLQIESKDVGLCHVIISDGVVNRHGLLSSQKNAEWLNNVLKKSKKNKDEIFLLTIDDAEKIKIIEKKQVLTQEKGADRK